LIIRNKIHFKLPLLSSQLIKSFVEYNKWYTFINKYRWWSEDRHKEYQWKSIVLPLEYVYNNIPYYQEVFKNLQASPITIKTFNDFAKPLFLTKEIIGEQRKDLIPRGINKNRLILYNAGGSTSVPLSFYRPKEMISFPIL
jgi:phenylacetate-CoA ligase